MELKITNNFPAVTAKLAALEKGVGNRALASAVNKTMAQASTQMAREIVAEFNVTSTYVKQRLRVRRASAKGGRFAIEASLIGGSGKRRSANIIAFVEKVVSLAEGKRRAKAGTLRSVFVKVKRKGGKKPVAGKYGQGAFIGNKGRTVFERVGPKRLPIEPVRTIDVAQMFNARRINRVVIAAIQAKFPGIFASEARFFLARFNSSGR